MRRCNLDSVGKKQTKIIGFLLSVQRGLMFLRDLRNLNLQNLLTFNHKALYLCVHLSSKITKGIHLLCKSVHTGLSILAYILAVLPIYQHSL